MKVVHKGKEETYQNFYPDEYEFKLCGGSIRPKDQIIHAKDETPDEQQKLRAKR